MSTSQFGRRSGISLPTGDTEPDPFALGEEGHEHQHIFFGTGTYDPIVGLEAYRTRGGLQVAGWLRLRTSLYENSFDYRAGTQVSTVTYHCEAQRGSQRW